MKEVNPLELIPGEIYYLEDTFVGLAKRRGCSHRGIGEFVTPFNLSNADLYIIILLRRIIEYNKGNLSVTK